MNRTSVAIQGEAGAFSHAAAIELLGPDIVLDSQRTFDALCEAVSSGRVEHGLLPIENSLVGSIHENYDRLRALDLHIVGEVQLRVRHCLILRPGTSLATLRHVSSHPVALAQCRRFFAERPHLVEHPTWDTAGAVRALLRDGLAGQGVIASRLAAEMHGGEVVLEGIEDAPENWTRFLLLSRTPGPADVATKTSLVFTLPHVPGALHRALGPFARRGLDLARIESRPLRGRPWEYAFYLDVLGGALDSGEMKAAIDELAGMARELRVLGAYPDGLARRAA